MASVRQALSQSWFPLIPVFCEMETWSRQSDSAGLRLLALDVFHYTEHC